MSARAELIRRLADLVGNDVLEIEDAQAGWPALATLHTEESAVPLALFIGKVGLSHRNRDDVERRFQNPGGRHPLVGVLGRMSVLVGLWEGDDQYFAPIPIVVMCDPARREGHTTRWSAFAPLSTLTQALETGWATHTSDSGEQVRCLLPELLPAAILADSEEIELDGRLVQKTVALSGVAEALEQSGGYEDIGLSLQRLRRATSSLVRDARFSSRVLRAYGYRCAMCGLGLGLVQGAHIYPASAPNSSDASWNGIALCANHHLAFDRYLIAVHPRTYELIYREDVLRLARIDSSVGSLVHATFDHLRPASPEFRRRETMFNMRYEHFLEEYEWFQFGSI